MACWLITAKNEFFRKALAKAAEITAMPRHCERLVLMADIRPPSQRLIYKTTCRFNVALKPSSHLLYFVRFGHGLNMTNRWRS